MLLLACEGRVLVVRVKQVLRALQLTDPPLTIVYHKLAPCLDISYQCAGTHHHNVLDRYVSQRNEHLFV